MLQSEHLYLEIYVVTALCRNADMLYSIDLMCHIQKPPESLLLGFVVQGRVPSTSGTWTPGGLRRSWKDMLVIQSSGSVRSTTLMPSWGEDGCFLYLLITLLCFTVFTWYLFHRVWKKIRLEFVYFSFSASVGTVRAATCRSVCGTWEKVAVTW